MPIGLVDSLSSDRESAAGQMITPEQCALIVIDIQEKLLPPIFEKERLLKNAQLLIRLALILEIPVISTMQYARGLGQTVPEIQSLLEKPSIDKQAFSCFGSDAFCSAVKSIPGQRNTVLLCGMESHICVTQTALGGLQEGYIVHVASDAVSSRTEWNWKIGLDRMRSAGGVISSTEMMIYELLRGSGTEAFKEMLKHLK